MFVRQFRAASTPWLVMSAALVMNWLFGSPRIPGILIGNPGRFHHAQSHSVTFAVLAGVLAALIAKKSRFHWALLVGLGYASHIILDFLTFDDSVPQGIPIFWPFVSDVFASPVTLFLNTSWGSGLVLKAHNFELLVREVGILGLFFVAALLYVRPRLPQPVLPVMASAGRSATRR